MPNSAAQAMSPLEQRVGSLRWDESADGHKRLAVVGGDVVVQDRRCEALGGGLDEDPQEQVGNYAVYLRTAEAMTIRARLDQLLDNPDDPATAWVAALQSCFCGVLNPTARACAIPLTRTGR